MDAFAKRRALFLEAMRSGVALFPAAPTCPRSSDVDHRYRPDSDLFYLTGFAEPGAMLILKPNGREWRSALLVRPRDPEREVWTGPRAGVDRAVERFGVDRAASIEKLSSELEQALANEDTVFFRFGRFPDVEPLVHATIRQLARRNREGIDAPHTFVDPGTIINEMRLVKTADDLAVLRKAIEITLAGHREAMRAVRPGMYEYELDAIVEYAFRRLGASGVAFPSTVGSGPNGCYLHYQDQSRHYQDESRRMEPGDLVLVDAGAELGLFSGDVTRTYPVGGRFSKEQARLYQIVLDAQTQAISRVRPGARFQDVHEAAVEVLAAGLVDLGFVPGPLSAAIAEESYKPFYMHRTAHWLGMDIHDVGTYRNRGVWRTLVPGHVLTIEPGLYVREGQKGAGREYWNTGIRIEDDIVVTETGSEVLTDGLPRTIEELEAELALPRRR